MPDTEAILAANAELAKSVDGLSAKVDQVGVRARTAFILALVLALVVVGVVVNAVHLSRTESKANRLQEYLTVSCVSANEARRAQRDLWTYVLKLSSENPKQTTAEKKQVVQFEAYVVQTFADRDCSKVAEGKVK